MAESGQIGKTNASTDGKDPQTIFLHYKWYPWVTPADGEPFQRDVTYYLDTKSGKTETYLLYHPRFSVNITGEVRVDGTVFSQKGRIGGWVIKDDRLKSYTGDVNICSDGHANFGSFYINPNGSIGGPTWSISAAGIASFMNKANQFQGSRYVLGDESKGFGFDNTGLHIPNDGALTIGDKGGQLRAHSDGAGFTFENCAYMNFSASSKITMNGNLEISGGKMITFSSGSSGGISIDSSGFHANGPGGNFGIDTSGNLDANYIRTKDLYINGTILETYIRNIVSSYFTQLSLGTSMATVRNGDNTGTVNVVRSVSLNKPS